MRVLPGVVHPPLPLTSGPLRVAVGAPSGVTSNSWRVWTVRTGDVYVSCRDNFGGMKVSLHQSGRWRMGMTQEAAVSSALLAPGQDRAWEVWDRPAPHRSGYTRAFQVQLLASEFGVRPDQRVASKWRATMFLSPPPAGRLTCITIFLTAPGLNLGHENEEFLVLARFARGPDELQVIAHHDPSAGYEISRDVAKTRIAAHLRDNGVTIPATSYLYLHGRAADGARFAMPAFAPRVDPASNPAS